MDPRDKKPRDFVAITRNIAEGVYKERRLQTKWFQTYEWLLNELAALEKETKNLCEEQQTVIFTDKFVREEGKTCLPFPVTTSGEYGWLASKPKFRLEKYGSYKPEYPDPMKNIEILTKDMPVLAAGIGYFR